MHPTASQARRDDINLTRLLRRLHKAVNEQKWDESSANDVWIQSLQTLQTVKYAKSLLRNLGISGVTPQDSQRYQDINANLERFETFLKSIEQRSTPRNNRPKSLLSSIPKPTIAVPEYKLESSPPEVPQSELPTDNLLTSPTDTALPSADLASPVPILISPLFPTTSKSTAIASGAFLENSKARHEAMTEQLAQMAVQLRKNAQHFSESLVEDKAVIEETQTKLEGNFGVMQKERIRLRDHRGKSGNTTCLVIFAVVGVLVVFVFMVALIRLTRR
ncbi:hypothetical protein BDP27DRAFT_1313712 [Rhodocollybia butyracea]|uniref:USE1-like protein n=1 Tax=Rhodocollybia butyracea TaxID=206335 RepID=A0A9P5Q8G8_9AGAR|nr:hypothetical protein BDP27DRAFT_1313712 [Rhodocollybia butyracea]